MPKSRPSRTTKVRAQSTPHPAPVRGREHVRKTVVRRQRDLLVVGIGTSAGGLEASRKLVGAIPAETGIAFILVQHLDPTHESMMVDLLAKHTALIVQQASDGMVIEPDHLYVIPPATYLAVANGVIRLSHPQARHGARLPYDFLLRSLAKECGARAVGVVLSGTGADGSIGLKALKEKGGLVIVQDPAEAGYDGMPQNAIATGLVDLVLPVARMSDAIIKFARGEPAGAPDGQPTVETLHDRLPEIIALLRSNTSHDFTLYKRGTLERRIERRMALASVGPGDGDRYLKLLQSDRVELDRLAKDLLINVTNFLRDPKVFALLEQSVIPDLIRNHEPGRAFRIWVAGCSTGEEAYSLAMLFREQLTVSGKNIALQIFASDVDPEAIESAREGLYTRAIEENLSPERLVRYFRKEKQGYRVSPELRAAVVFTVQDILVDPPFSRIDLISCRNVMIYLRPEAQAKAISVFNFALNPRGLLLLGSAETIAADDTRFTEFSKADRLYQRTGTTRANENGLAKETSWSVRAFSAAGPGRASVRQVAFADLCQRLVMDSFAPAAVLINRDHECLYSLGPTDRYLRVPAGQPSHDLLAMVSEAMRSKLRLGIQRASEAKEPVAVAGGLTSRDGRAFTITVQPAPNEGESLFLVCFVDAPIPEKKETNPVPAADLARVAELERELETAKSELRAAIRNLEISGEEQKAINEEALSVNEEFQSTNEELLTSKEELQSLNEELTALNTQLQETLERQRETSDDLQNILYSTNIATLFLDTDLNIRFFTPATKLLFNIIRSDVGRPLADLHSLSADEFLPSDAGAVLHNLAPIEREVEALGGVWFNRRILPYHAHDGTVEGVVITFTDVTERKHAARALEDAKQQAELANVAKSRFLAAASHDLRQPLQTLALLQGLLEKMVVGEGAQKLVARLDQTLGAISSMLNTLLDLNQIEAGTVRTEMVSFPVDTLLQRLKDDFGVHAQSQGLDLRVVKCTESIFSDPHLLEQMIRNLLSNALKYTERGKVLVGCKRRKGMLSITVCDTGVGIPEEELQAIFEEYHQLNNAARERSRGLGLGLSIVHRLGKMLGHAVRVRSQLGKGSSFAIDVKLAPHGLVVRPENVALVATVAAGASTEPNLGAILVIEDDLDVRELLELLLKNQGHRVVVASDGAAALALVERRDIRLDLIIADYNLPNGMNGLEVAAKLREKSRREVPVVILTGDITTATMRRVAEQNCLQLNKPMNPKELTQVIERLVPRLPTLAPAQAGKPDVVPAVSTIFIVDDDDEIRMLMREIFVAEGKNVEDFSSCEAFLAAYRRGCEGCLLIDAYLPGMGGIELLKRLHEDRQRLPSIMITGNSDVSMAVEAMKAGASDFLEKPASRGALLESVNRALIQSKDTTKLSTWKAAAASRLAKLTPQQRRVMDMVLAGSPSKNIASDLGISQRTVENHRAAIMTKAGVKSLPALARLALAAASEDVS